MICHVETPPGCMSWRSYKFSAEPLLDITLFFLARRYSNHHNRTDTIRACLPDSEGVDEEEVAAVAAVVGVGVGEGAKVEEAVVEDEERDAAVVVDGAVPEAASGATITGLESLCALSFPPPPPDCVAVLTVF